MTAPVIVFDVGGTQLRAARMEGARMEGAPGPRLVGRVTRPTPRGDGPALIAALTEVGRALIDASPEPPAAVGLALAGFADRETGVVAMSPGLELVDEPLAAPLSAALGLPVRLVNDVNAAAWAESRTRGVDDLVAVFVGTGVGTGLVCDGHLLEGRHGAAAEGGHLAWRSGGGAEIDGVDPGCFEAFLGGRSLGRRARAAGIGPDAAALIAAAGSGDERALAILADAEQALAALVRLLVIVADPALVVVGGGVARHAPSLLRAAAAALDPHPLAAGLGPVQVQAASVDEDAGLLGAGLLAAAGLGDEGRSDGGGR